jgi:hypothetical protein
MWLVSCLRGSLRRDADKVDALLSKVGFRLVGGLQVCCSPLDRCPGGVCCVLDCCAMEIEALPGHCSNERAFW